MSSERTRLQRRIAPVDLVFDGEMTFAASVSTVWPYLIDYPSWQNYSVVRHISGRPGQEGAVVLLKKKEGGIELPAYYARTVKLDPYRRVIWKTYPEHRTPDNDCSGIIEFRVEERSGATCFSYHTLYEFLVPHEEESELETFRRTQSRNIEAIFSSVFPKLRQRVEQGV